MEKKTTLGDIMWFNILKESKQVSRTMGSIDWENESVPDKEEDNCRRNLLKILERAKRYKDKPTMKDLEFELGWLAAGNMVERIKEIPEEVICELLKQFKNLEKGSSFNITDRPDGFTLRGIKTTNARPVYGETLLLIGHRESGYNYFGITLIWHKRKYTRRVDIGEEALITETKEYKRRKLNFHLLSNKIFGEYY